MKAQKLLDEIGKIDDDFISEADTNTFVKTKWFRFTSVAAACIVIFIAISVLNNRPSDLPMLTIGPDFGTYSFEGYLAYDISQLKNGNPWTEDSNIQSMPVFQNPISYDGAGVPTDGLTAEDMIKKAKEIALILGLEVDTVYTNPTEEQLKKWREKERSIPGNENFEPPAIPYEAEAICGDITIKVEANGFYRIFFDYENGIPLPDEYSFPIKEEYYMAEKITTDPITGEVTYEKEEHLPDEDNIPDYDTEINQANGTLSYLLNEYKSIVGMKTPELNLTSEYNMYGQLNILYKAYEGAGDLLDKILGYNFNRVAFSSNSKGELWIIDGYKEDLSQKLGDYPIISPDEAKKLLLKKRYITTVPEALPSEEYIASVELMYRTDRFNQVFMPYYRFLVELPTMQRENGLKNYGAFYVPAVEGRYLTNMPLWDGRFN